MGIAGPVYAAHQQGRATDAQTRAAAEANAEARRQFDLNRADTAPYRSVGTGALGLLAQLYGIGVPATQGEFDEQAYLAANPDVARDPYFATRAKEHYEQHGAAEGRQAHYSGGTAAIAAGAPNMSVFTESPDYQFNLAENQKALDRSLASRGRALSGAGVREGLRYASGMASNEFGSFYNRLANLAGLGQAGVAQSGAAGLNAANTIGANTIGAANARASGYQNVGQIFQNASANTANNVALFSQLWGGGGRYSNSSGYAGAGSYNGGGLRVV
jgi:hypothetical protein